MEKLLQEQKVSTNRITICGECNARFILFLNVEIHQSMTKEKKKS